MDYCPLFNVVENLETSDPFEKIRGRCGFRKRFCLETSRISLIVRSTYTELLFVLVFGGTGIPVGRLILDTRVMIFELND